MQHQAQSINQAVANTGLLTAGTQGVYRNSTLEAGLVGSTATGTLEFNAAGTADASLYVEQGTMAVDGLSLAIIQPGIYRVEAVVAQIRNTANTYALAFGATVVTNAAAPTFATGGVLQLVAGTTLPNVGPTDTSVVMLLTMQVRLGTAKTTPAVTSANTLRILATAAAGGIVTGLTAAGCSIRVTRINDAWS